jgi:hypothetical protein
VTRPPQSLGDAVCSELSCSPQVSSRYLALLQLSGQAQPRSSKIAKRLLRGRSSSCMGESQTVSRVFPTRRRVTGAWLPHGFRREQ